MREIWEQAVLIFCSLFMADLSAEIWYTVLNHFMHTQIRMCILHRCSYR